MKVLHICNDFNYQKLYINLFRENAKSIDQVVYCGNRNKKIIGNNIDTTISNIEYFNPHIVYRYDKINYFGKAYRQYNFIKKNIGLNTINHVHAHTFFSDGVLAFLINLFFNIPYTVSVRNTDVNTFFKFKPYLTPLAYIIYRKAKSIHFPTGNIKRKFFKRVLLKDNKSRVISNPLDDFWIDNQLQNKKSFNKRKSFLICYVGKIDSNKNLDALVCAIERLNLNYKIKLKVVGKFKSKNIKRRVSQKEFVEHINHIHSKDKLKNIYRESHLLCLPSKSETFGMVCLESLSQGTPFLIRKKQGLFGLINAKEGGHYFESDSDISTKIEQIIRRGQMSIKTYVNFEHFRVTKISDEMLNIYQLTT